MDDFKRTFCNEDMNNVTIPYFWKHFDPTKYSIYTCEYLYPDELGMTFMSANLVNGMFQRLEKLKKYAFGIMTIFGVNNKNTIKGLWIWHGTGLLFDVDKDFAIDSESYKWTKMDPKAEETKTMVTEYFIDKYSNPDPYVKRLVYK